MRNGADERVAVTAAVASMLAALTLCPLVSGVTWLAVAAILVITVMVTGIVARQLLRWWPAVAVVQSVVLLVTVLVLFTRSQIAHGPSALFDLYSAGMTVTQQQAPPVEATQGIVLLVAGSTGLVALLVDVLAATLRQPALAGLPLLAVYCVPAALLDGGLPWYYFFVAASGFLLLLSADSGDRIRGWGRVLTSASASSAAGTGSRRVSGPGTARGGRRVGVATVLVAVLLPAMVPGLSNRIIGGSGQDDGKGKGHTITRINPILDLRKNLETPPDAPPLLTYQTSVADPAPLRIVTSDVFDGNTWAPSTTPIPKRNRADTLPPAPGLTQEVKTTPATTRISIGPLKETYLPLPYPATHVSVKGTWLYDRNTLNVIGGDGQTTEGLNYEVQHLDVEPTAKQLAESPPPDVVASGQYLALPQNLPAVIRETALQVAGTGSNYQRAVRLQEWFRSSGGFQYSLDAPTTKTGDSGSDAIVQFLKQKRGYCVHFASTMAVMARTLNIPARVAVGFLPGTPSPSQPNTREVKAQDAHAWPELYFTNIGWVRFEPTPRSGQTTPPAWSVPPAGLLPKDTSSTAQPSARPSTTPSASTAPETPKQELKSDPKTSTSSGFGIPWRLVLIVLAMVLALSTPRLVTTLASRRRWNRAAGSTAGLAEAAWDDLQSGLGDLGVRWAAAWTPRAVQLRLTKDYQLDAERTAALNRLVTEIENARYAPPSDELGRSMEERVDDVVSLVSAVAVTKSGRTQWLARLWPASGLAALSEFGPWMSSTADRAGRQASALGTQVRDKVGSGRQ